LGDEAIARLADGRAARARERLRLSREAYLQPHLDQGRPDSGTSPSRCPRGGREVCPGPPVAGLVIR
jgi:hypothetical protein